MSDALRATGHVALGSAPPVEVDIAVAPGSITAVVGPNGVGKSLTLAAILGLVPLDGSVTVQGRDVSGLAVHERGLGWAPQTPALLPRRSALRQIRRYSKPGGPLVDVLDSGSRTETATRALEAVGLQPDDRRHPHRLSGGEAQRVSVVRALAASSTVLLDEPTSAQDTAGGEALRTLLRAYTRAGGAALVVAHRPEDAYLLADALIVLEGGTVVQRGAPATLAADPASAYVARAVGATVLEGDVAAGLLHTTWGVVAVPDTAPSGRAVVVVRPGSITVSRDAPQGSARNRFEVTVRGVRRTAEVTALDLEGPPDLVAHLTQAAATELALRPGDRVWATVKANDLGVHRL